MVNHSAIVRHYLGWRLAWDLVSVLPVDAGIWSTLRLHAVFRANRLLRLTRVEANFRAWGVISLAHAHVVRTARIVVYLFLAVHIPACVFFAIATQTTATNGDDIDDWTAGVVANVSTSAASLNAASGLYLRAMVWALASMTGLGPGTGFPSSDGQFGFQLALFGIGLALVSFLVGQVCPLPQACARAIVCVCVCVATMWAV